eukprot:TRINITY_DN68_c0_g1_i1.p1 TRINITY_DN68_c0_g1~~TRINITY_DN68_c0_g1_i1.p1  ORF type:complete len:404 (-),score=92.90 TRINITY_DN68_c0_g1_i1:101-1312(-)
MFQRGRKNIRLLVAFLVLMAVGAFLLWPASSDTVYEVDNKVDKIEKGDKADQPDQPDQAGQADKVDEVNEEDKLDEGPIVETYETITVAFIGDTVLDPPKEELVTLLEKNNIDFLFHGGDIAYIKDAKAAWSSFVDLDFLRSVPIVATAGNADVAEWNMFTSVLKTHNDQTSASQEGKFRCSGIAGLQSSCTADGIVVVQIVTEPSMRKAAEAAGFRLPMNNNKFIKDTFQATKNTTLRVCHFHHPFVDYKVDMPRTDIVNVVEYDTCRQQGAMIVSAHDHIYARTKLMINYETHRMFRPTKPDEEPFKLRGGNSFSVISGLGGKSTVAVNPQLAGTAWWAKVWPENDHPTRNSQVGALICTVPTTPDVGKVECRFESGEGETIDSFSFVTAYKEDDFPAIEL